MNPPAARTTPPRARTARALIALDLDADDLPSVDDERLGPGIRHHASGAARHGGTESFHEEASGGIDVLGLVPAWHRDRKLVKGIGVLAATEEQPGVIGRFAVRFVAEGGPKRHADGDQPIEVVRRTLAVGVKACLVRVGSERGPEERRHVLGRVVEAAGALQGRAASQVDEPARVGRRPARRTGAFDGQHVRVRLPGRHDR